MSQQAIEKITKAEEQAEVLLRVATERAADSRADMEKTGKEHLAFVELDATQKSKEKLAQARAATEALTQKKHAEAKAEADELAEKARERMETAVKAIVWGTMKKCQ